VETIRLDVAPEAVLAADVPRCPRRPGARSGHHLLYIRSEVLHHYDRLWTYTRLPISGLCTRCPRANTYWRKGGNWLWPGCGADMSRMRACRHWAARAITTSH